MDNDLKKLLEEEMDVLSLMEEVDEVLAEEDVDETEQDPELVELLAQADKMLEGYEEPVDEFENVPQPEQLSGPKEFKTKVFDKRRFEQHKKADDTPQNNKMSIKL